jgi:hypothetical protein
MFPYHINFSKKGSFITRPSSIFLKLTQREFFSKKNNTFFSLAKKSPTKKLQGYQLFGVSRFLQHTLFDYSKSFNRKNKCLGALERYFI